MGSETDRGRQQLKQKKMSVTEDIGDVNENHTDTCIAVDDTALLILLMVKRLVLSLNQNLTFNRRMEALTAKCHFNKNVVGIGLKYFILATVDTNFYFIDEFIN